MSDPVAKELLPQEGAQAAVEERRSIEALLALPDAVGGWRDHVIGGALFLGYVVWLLATARSLGFPRDESFYFSAGANAAGWFDTLFKHPADAFKEGAIHAGWGYNHEHPSLMKGLFGLSWMFFHQKWHLFSDASTAFRLPGMAMGGLSLWLTYLFGARVFSRRAGLVAAVGLALMPRVFFHAHLACFDVPIMAMWLLATYAYFRWVQEQSWGWVIAAGIAYGLALETKHNAWIMPAVFVPHALWLCLQTNRAGRTRWPYALVSMAVLGPLVFVALWPWMWSDTANRIRDYMNFHLHHDYYSIEFLGVNVYGPPAPKSYAPIMILVTVPTVTLLLFGVGAFDRLRALWTRLIVQKNQEPGADPWEADLLLFLSLCAPIAVFFLPATPIFGGTKHWLPAYPFLAILAGRGFELVAAAMHRAFAGIDKNWLGARGREVALAAVCVAAPLAVTVHSHPFGLSTYVPFAGGTAGGADWGFNRQFWGFTTQSVGPWLAAHAPRGATVFLHDTTFDAWGRMQDEGRMRRDLRAVGSPSDAMFSLVQHELHMNEVDYQIWVVDGHTSPAYVLTHDGVPIVSVYERK